MFPGDTFTLDSGEGALADYPFNRHAIMHRFCMACGCEAFAMDKGSDGAATVAVNLRRVPDVDVNALTIHRVDGASF
ncbi:glutathione-dependent formaldehyde-activating protein [uncultured Sphingomonas sp.]|uniref:glutathione-dependent formaldehyde-activating protein n=1 Tax=uncultured Sphingomonas sp. TaxID=158754 RepID=UPI0025D685AF|nr:glutathione-dependent formaldehyde-activating protein [uncultured Sphingomonas sp.]